MEGLREEAEGLGEEMSRPGFWDDPEKAKEVSARFSRVQGRIELLDGLRERLADSEELLELAEEDGELLARGRRRSCGGSSGRSRSRRWPGSSPASTTRATPSSP